MARAGTVTSRLNRTISAMTPRELVSMVMRRADASGYVEANPEAQMRLLDASGLSNLKSDPPS